MKPGGYDLRSWVSNNETLAAAFVEDGCTPSHSVGCEKVLGYRYYPTEDLMSG